MLCTRSLLLFIYVRIYLFFIYSFCITHTLSVYYTLFVFFGPTNEWNWWFNLALTRPSKLSLDLQFVEWNHLKEQMLNHVNWSLKLFSIVLPFKVDTRANQNQTKPSQNCLINNHLVFFFLIYRIWTDENSMQDNYVFQRIYSYINFQGPFQAASPVVITSFWVLIPSLFVVFT